MFKIVLSGGVGGAIGYGIFKYKSHLKSWFKQFNQQEPQVIIKSNLKLKDRNDKLLNSSYKISHENENSKLEFICNKLEENNIPIFEIINEAENQHFKKNWHFNKAQLEVGELKFFKQGLKIKNLLTEKECRDLIQITHSLKFDKLQNKEIRDFQKLYLDSFDFSSILWTRIKAFMVDEIICNGISWKPIGLNERIKFEKCFPFIHLNKR
jgi:hypothetical protein